MKSPAEERFREIVLVLTGYYPESNPLVHATNIKCADDIFKAALKAARREGKADGLEEAADMIRKGSFIAEVSKLAEAIRRGIGA